MNILAIGAHPDDCEISCGGTLAKYSENGHKIFMVSVTNGEIGSQTLSPAEISEIRRKEGERAAAVIGAEYIWMGFQDQRFLIDNDARMAFVDVFRYADPDVVITHCQDDFSGDHRLVGQMVNDVCMLPMAPAIRTKLPSIHKAPVLYYWTGHANLIMIPEQFVDITDQYETKLKMVECHQTQIEWLKYHTGGNLTDDTYVNARFRGLQCGVRYAEAFQMVKAAPRNCCGTLLP